MYTHWYIKWCAAIIAKSQHNKREYTISKSACVRVNKEETNTSFFYGDEEKWRIEVWASRETAALYCWWASDGGRGGLCAEFGLFGLIRGDVFDQ